VIKGFRGERFNNLMWAHGFQWVPHPRGWNLPRSRSKGFDDWRLERLVRALCLAGHSVKVVQGRKIRVVRPDLSESTG
jgi:hypothetical protein